MVRVAKIKTINKYRMTLFNSQFYAYDTHFANDSYTPDGNKTYLNFNLILENEMRQLCKILIKNPHIEETKTIKKKK